MATQYIKFKRSSVPGKRPSISQIELGELALNTYDGRIFTKQENVGIGTTVTLLNVWTENIGGGAYYNDGFVGIGTTNPQAALEVVSTVSGGGIRVSSNGINSPGFRLISNDTGGFAQNLLALGFESGLVGSVPGDYCIRNSSGGGILLGISTAVGFTSPNQATGYVRLTPSGELLVGTSSTITTGTTSQPLQVNGGAYFNGDVGVGITNPITELTINGRISAGNSISSQSIGNVINQNVGTGYSAARSFNLVDTSSVLKIVRNNDSFGPNVEFQHWNVGIISLISYWDINSEQGTFSIRDRIGNYDPTKQELTRIFINEYGNVLLGASNQAIGPNRIQSIGYGTANILQVNGGAYVSGNVGVGTTNPTSQLHVIGNGLVSGVVTATTFIGALSGNATGLSGTPNITVGVITATDLTLSGNLTVNGTTTILNTETLQVEDKNIELGLVTSPTNTTADGGGITLKGTTDKTFNWVNATSSWTSSENLNLLTGKTYKINGTDVLSSTTLGSGVVNSSLTSVGTLGQLNVSGVSTFGGNVYLGDNDSLYFGDGNDLIIFHDGGNSIIGDFGTGNLYLTGDNSVLITNAAASETKANFITNGAVELYYDNVKTFETTGYGATVFGTLQSQHLNVSGVVTATFIGNVTGNLNSTGVNTASILSGTNLNYSGVGTITTLNSTTGTISNITNTNINTSGVTTTARLNVGTGGTIITTTTGGFVGIGTTNPQQQVQVGSAGTDSGLVISGFGSIGITTNNPTTFIDITQNTPTKNTVQFGSFGIQSFDNVNGFLSNNGYYDGTKWIYRRNGHSSLLQFLSGNIWLRTLPVGTAGSTANIDTRLAIQNNGNIGIGTDNPLVRFQVNENSSNVVAITSTGFVGIGTTNPTSRLQVQGDVLVSGVITSTDYNSASDLKLKENIQVIENPIDKVLQINGVSFDWKETGKSSMGVIAQDVEKVLPELVNGTDSKTVNYNGLIGLLIEVVKEQQKEINILKERLG